jgi:hypothetical protein
MAGTREAARPSAILDSSRGAEIQTSVVADQRCVRALPRRIEARGDVQTFTGKERKKTMKRALALITIVTLSVPVLLADNVPAPPSPQPGSAKLYALLGSWSGQAEMKDGDKPASKVNVKFECRKTSGGWGIRCEAALTSAEMNYLETDLFGYDAAAGKVHWYSVTNAGEVHDHVGTWTSASRLFVRHTGSDVTEDITLALNGANEMGFEVLTTPAGGATSTMRGSLTKR